MKIISDIKKVKDGVYAIETPLDIEEGRYTLSISKYRKNRSLEQNAYLWELLTEIVKKENGGRSTEELRLSLYTKLLQEAGAVAINCEILPKDILKFQSSYRATRIIGFNDKTQRIKAIAYIGTSHMNTKEMSDFIDCVLDYAAQAGIYAEYWKGLLKDEKQCEKAQHYDR